jgi:hypothetical protein
MSAANTRSILLGHMARRIQRVVKDTQDVDLTTSRISVGAE